MSKYRVTGKTTVYVDVVVEATSEDEAFDVAATEISGLTGFVGNGGLGDKLVGVYGENVTIEPSDEIEWNEAEVEEDE